MKSAAGKNKHLEAMSLNIAIAELLDESSPQERQRAPLRPSNSKTFALHNGICGSLYFLVFFTPSHFIYSVCLDKFINTPRDTILLTKIAGSRHSLALVCKRRAFHSNSSFNCPWSSQADRAGLANHRRKLTIYVSPFNCGS